VIDPVIMHRDARVVVVDKPSGLATHRGWDGSDDALLQRVRDAVGCYVYPIHRLDRGASGLVVFALDGDAARALSLAWADADKRYLAITRGHPPDHLMIDHAIPRDPGQERGKARVAARTEIWRHDTFGRYALVEARLHTGRLHQIRRHLKHVSCPLIGDVRYGKGEHNRIFRAKHGLSRLALHCTRITVAHPAGGELTVTSPLPADLAGAIASCRQRYAEAAGPA